MTLDIGVIGAGTHGARYLRHLVRGDVPGMRAVALCRRDEEAGRRLSGELDVPWFAHAGQLVADPRVAAVIIATPPNTHYPLSCQVLDAGKPVLLEKPMTGTLDEARKLAERAQAPDAPVLMVAQTLRWHPALLRARELWPRLGRVHHVRLAQRLQPTTLAWQRNLSETVGGSVLLTGVHIFDLARWLTGREIVMLESRQRQVLNPVVEDFFLARAQLDDGCWVSLEVSKYTQSRACWLEAVGEDGQLAVDYQTGRILLRCGREEVREHVDGGVPTLPGVLESWRDAILGRQAAPVTSIDGLRTMEIVDACYRSAATGETVDLQ
jgi:predicted dehydrogenase